MQDVNSSPVQVVESDQPAGLPRAPAPEKDSVIVKAVPKTAVRLYTVRRAGEPDVAVGEPRRAQLHVHAGAAADIKAAFKRAERDPLHDFAEVPAIIPVRTAPPNRHEHRRDAVLKKREARKGSKGASHG